MNFQSSCYCHTTSYTLSINLQFIAPKKKTVSLQNQIHKTIHLFSHNYIMTSAFCCYPVTSCVQFFVTPWFAAPQASLSFAISQTLSKFMFTELVMPSNHLILPASRSAFSLSQHQGLFQRVGSLHRVARVLELHLKHQPFQ